MARAPLAAPEAGALPQKPRLGSAAPQQIIFRGIHLQLVDDPSLEPFVPETLRESATFAQNTGEIT